MLPPFVSSPSAALWLAGAYLVWIVPEAVRSRFRRPGPQVKANDRLSGAVLMLCIWSGVFFAWVAGFRFRQFAIPWDRGILFPAGIVLMLAGVAFRWYAIRVLGRFFTVVVAVSPGQTVVEAGPYRWLRHPSYSGAILTLFGFGLVFAHWLSLLFIMAFAVIGYGYRIAVEERVLLAALGEPYRLYMRRTKRIIPFVI
jgi:protein-S-isoprenylcysteine O-methyltransferase Ste14